MIKVKVEFYEAHENLDGEQVETRIAADEFENLFPVQRVFQIKAPINSTTYLSGYVLQPILLVPNLAQNRIIP